LLRALVARTQTTMRVRELGKGKRLRQHIAAVLLVVFVFNHAPAHAWGNEGHIRINRVAAQKLPKETPLFFRLAVDRLGYLGPEPDRWRNKESEPALKYAQEPEHYIDLERLPADFGDLPVDRHLYMRRLYEFRAKALAAGMDPKKADELLPEKVGYQPYVVMEIMDRLRVAFREYRHTRAQKLDTRGIEANIVFYAGWMGHYVGDAAQPLHTTIHYDGWVGPENPHGYRTEKGIHYEFEAPFAAQFREKDFAPLVHLATKVDTPRVSYLAYLRESLGQVERVYQLDKTGAFKANNASGTPEAREFTQQRLAAGAQMLANLWYTAWLESAVDPPDPWVKPPVPKKN
jgi:hypothetical protein